ncbi:hypothetical protein CEXT_5201 [Caerostris extrusa]|uniref:Uncharacterized protein n=1 Tax=Caerostris extrusa TaxID=172846 RepID=A0AAV4PNJ4_CAEEX|nr:hypothetical protein CEXT_5201 [Caerostris extrusa]
MSSKRILPLITCRLENPTDITNVIYYNVLQFSLRRMRTLRGLYLGVFIAATCLSILPLITYRLVKTSKTPTRYSKWQCETLCPNINRVYTFFQPGANWESNPQNVTLATTDPEESIDLTDLKNEKQKNNEKSGTPLIKT